MLAITSNLLAARQQMAFSLGFHIVLSCFGVAFPALIFLVHRRGLRGDPVALVLAQRWGKAAAVLFAVGAVSGTILSFEMGLLWPGLMSHYGDVIGLPFALEGISFFTEAIFLGIYLYGWGRLPPRLHLAALVPMMIAGITGTFCILAVNAWMNAPAGFTLVNGVVTDVRPLDAMFTTRVWPMFAHMWVACFMVTGFGVASVYAVGLLRGRRDRLHRLGLLVPLAMASAAAVVQPVVGHVTGSGLADAQPSKLAAMELNTTTEARSPLVIGGILIDGEVRYAIRIPALGSLFATGSINGVVPGFDQIPDDERPPATLVHWAFQGMVAIGTGLAVLSVVFWVQRRRGRDLTRSRRFLQILAVAGVAAAVCVELGWITTEVGRQPWIAFQVMRTAEAVTPNQGVWITFTVVMAVYVALATGAIVVLRSMARRWRDSVDADLPSPYGPDRVAEMTAR